MTDPVERPLLMICDCLGTMTPDAAALAAARGADAARPCSELCRGEAAAARDALASGRMVTIACGQEAPAFADLAAELGAEERLTCIDIRDRAGWSDDPADKTPKMAALLAEGALKRPAAPAMEIVSEGVCLVFGAGERALAAAERLAATLSVTCILSEAEDLPPARVEMDVARGRLVGATGALGGFDVRVDAYAPAVPGGRGALRFGPGVDGARSGCDLIVDLSGGAPLFPSHGKRDGYVRADPGDPVAVERALFDAAQLVGTFEKPLYVRFEAEICAHSRARKSGCQRCLNVCPTGAILPDGDAVRIDPAICAGCGACAAVCPTGAVAYDDPPRAHLARRMRALAEGWRAAGGGAARLLIHDRGFGAEMIALSARFGGGLPADVIPLEVPEVEGIGHADLIGALGCGFAEVLLLEGPRTDLSALEGETALAAAILGGTAAAGRARRLAPGDPDALEEMLRGAAPAPVPGAAPILALGGARETVRLAAKALGGGADAPIPLPEGAPYGAVLVNGEACTLCLACVSLCPTGALVENPDKPQLRFQEDACVQCGICASTCPETAIALEPRLNLADGALSPVVLREEEPAACIECGALFGVKSTIERIAEKLVGANWMYETDARARLIRMCDDCRVRAQMHGESSPFAVAPRRPVRRTEDYLDGGRLNGSGEDD